MKVKMCGMKSLLAAKVAEEKEKLAKYTKMMEQVEERLKSL